MGIYRTRQSSLTSTTKPTPCTEMCEDLVVKVRKAVIKLNKMNTEGQYKISRYYDNGQLKAEENWKDGKQDGLAKGWHSNGQLEYETNWKDGEIDGLAKIWYPNGQLRSESNYKDDEIDGEDKTWYEDGQLESTIYYTDGYQVL